jgi:hypothetical protein
VIGFKQAAKQAGVTEELLALWIKTGRIKPDAPLSTAHLRIPGLDEGDELFGLGRFLFTADDIEKLREMAEGREKRARRSVRTPEPVDPEFFTVAQVAERWGLSTDTIRRLFMDEPGVIPLGKPTRGKRKRVTLRIPKDVVERVKRKRAQK